jgi:hypothetical protein
MMARSPNMITLDLRSARLTSSPSSRKVGVECCSAEEVTDQDPLIRLFFEYRSQSHENVRLRLET